MGDGSGVVEGKSGGEKNRQKMRNRRNEENGLPHLSPKPTLILVRGMSLHHT